MPQLFEIAMGEPHPDIELGLPRERRCMRVVEPAAGVEEGCGLIFFIHGFGGFYNDAYADKLLPWLAEQYNCVAVAVDYYAADLYQPAGFSLAPDFFHNVSRVYGIDEAQLQRMGKEVAVPALLALLRKHGHTQLDMSCTFYRDKPGVYQSFGLLQALDHLQALYQLLAHYPALDRRRLFAIGTSFGGFIVSLLRKLAPNSFRMLIDNSGFASALDDSAAVFGWSSTDMDGIKALVRSPDHWEDDPRSPRCFLPACAALRDLRDARQLGETRTAWFSFMSSRDELFPASSKAAQLDAFAARGPAELKIVYQQDLDGRLFKTLDHGMSASIRGLFAHCYARLENLAPAALASEATDFERGTQLRFDCGARCYSIRFDPNTGVHMRWEPS